MENCAKYIFWMALFFSNVSFCSTVNNDAIRYLHNKVLERAVPDFKEFNHKRRVLFRTKDIGSRAKMVDDLSHFVHDAMNRLNYEKQRKKATASQITSINLVQGLMKRKMDHILKIQKQLNRKIV